MSVTTNLGKVACVGKGEFNVSTRYEALDIISYIGSSYLVIAPCTGIYPPNENYYMLLASKGDTGARGERGQTGATGAKGEKGDTGTGLDIKGTYASIDALSAAVASPEQGDMYFIGTAAPYTVYMWDTTSGTGAWISQGALQGTKGDAGAVFTPNVTAAGVLSWTNDGGLTNPQSVNIKGPKGERGDVGIGVPAGGRQGQMLKKATDADHDTEWTTVDAETIGAAPKDHAHSATEISGVAENNFVVGNTENLLAAKSPEEVREILNIPVNGAVLWEGSWTSGTITVPNTDKYKMFILGFAGQGTTVIAVKHNTHIRGAGGYSSATPTITYYQFTATFEGDVWTFVAANSLQHTPNNDHSKAENITLTQILGLI